MEECAHNQRHRMASRRIQTPHQDPDSAAVSRDRYSGHCSPLVRSPSQSWRMADIEAHKLVNESIDLPCLIQYPRLTRMVRHAALVSLPNVLGGQAGGTGPPPPW